MRPWQSNAAHGFYRQNNEWLHSERDPRGFKLELRRINLHTLFTACITYIRKSICIISCGLVQSSSLLVCFSFHLCSGVLESHINYACPMFIFSIYLGDRLLVSLCSMFLYHGPLVSVLIY